MAAERSKCGCISECSADLSSTLNLINLGDDFLSAAVYNHYQVMAELTFSLAWLSIRLKMSPV